MIPATPWRGFFLTQAISLSFLCPNMINHSGYFQMLYGPKQVKEEFQVAVVLADKIIVNGTGGNKQAANAVLGATSCVGA